MPEEIVFIVIMSLVMGTILITSVFKQIFSYLRARHVTPTDEGLTTGELEAVLHRVVAEAILPLEDKIDALEARLDAPYELDAAHPPLVLDDAPLTPEEAAPVARRRRSR